MEEIKRILLLIRQFFCRHDMEFGQTVGMVKLASGALVGRAAVDCIQWKCKCVKCGKTYTAIQKPTK